MSGFNNYEEEDQVPGLLPLKKKVDPSVVTPSDKNSKNNDTLNNIIKDSIQKTPISAQGKDPQKSFGYFKKGPQKEPVEQADKKNKDKKTIQKKDTQFNKLQNEKTKQNEKMKNLIAQMLNSMTIKNNATQELYPVSSEIIEQLLSKIDQEIMQLNNEADRKSANQNNLHAQKQLQVIKREINHCILIKELYYEKMNYRNKIQALEEEIINLRSENRDLKLKVSRGIQSIENYKHNLPCDREKQLIEKLSICTQELGQEREMRQNLQKNIEGIIMNFKKLYDQADAARKIVTQKLKQVEERQKRLKKNKDYENEYSKSDQMKSQKKVTSFDLSQQRKQNDSKLQEESNDNYQISTRRQYDNQTEQKSPFRGKPMLIMTQPAEEKTKAKMAEKEKQKIKQKSKEREKQKQKKKTAEAQSEAMTLQEKIKKMRNNQINFKKNFAT